MRLDREYSYDVSYIIEGLNRVEELLIEARSIRPSDKVEKHLANTEEFRSIMHRISYVFTMLEFYITNIISKISTIDTYLNLEGTNLGQFLKTNRILAKDLYPSVDRTYIAIIRNAHLAIREMFILGNDTNRLGRVFNILEVNRRLRSIFTTMPTVISTFDEIMIIASQQFDFNKNKFTFVDDLVEGVKVTYIGCANYYDISALRQKLARALKASNDKIVSMFGRYATFGVPIQVLCSYKEPGAELGRYSPSAGKVYGEVITIPESAIILPSTKDQPILPLLKDVQKTLLHEWAHHVWYTKLSPSQRFHWMNYHKDNWKPLQLDALDTIADLWISYVNSADSEEEAKRRVRIPAFFDAVLHSKKLRGRLFATVDWILMAGASQEKSIRVFKAQRIQTVYDLIFSIKMHRAATRLYEIWKELSEQAGKDVKIRELNDYLEEHNALVNNLDVMEALHNVGITRFSALHEAVNSGFFDIDVPVHKTTGYGATSPIESFAEALALYMTYGPSTLDKRTVLILQKTIPSFNPSGYFQVEYKGQQLTGSRHPADIYKRVR